MKEGQVLKYVCKFCNKSFPCGRSLGGHMRSHLTNTTPETAEKLSNRAKSSGGPRFKAEISSSSSHLEAGYGLRENPKKSLRFSGSDDEACQSQLLLFETKFCKECGKGFQSFKALFAHMKSHPERETVSTTKENNSFEELCSLDSANHKLVLDSQSDNETNPEISYRNDKKKRRSQRRTRYMGTSNSSSFSVANKNNNNGSSVSEAEQEQEEVAMCLIMLSRDASPWNGTESSDNFSGFSKPGKAICSEKFGSMKLNAEESENCASGFGKLWSRKSRTEVSINGVLKKQEIRLEKESAVGEFGSSKRKPHDGNYEHELESDLLKKPMASVSDLNMLKNSNKRSKFECTTCNKTFHSYQALGGHRASHKKTKGCFASTTDNSENSIETDDHNKLRNHLNSESFVDHHDIVTYGGDDHDHDDGSKAEKATETNTKLPNKKSSNTKGHECPICLKVFASGQALGGHKRSHLANGSESKQSKAAEIKKPVPEIRDFLDLNLPAPDEEESNGHVASLKPWWAETSHKHEALVGLISN